VGLVLVTEREWLRELARVWRFASHVGRSAATIALVMAVSNDRDERETFQNDLGQVTMSIMLAAADLGIGSGHASVVDQELARRVLRGKQRETTGSVETKTASSDDIQRSDQHSSTRLFIRRFGVRISGGPTTCSGDLVHEPSTSLGGTSR
jgi:hypothetical protein